jgi:valyl-tRNA synthetase
MSDDEAYWDAFDNSKEEVEEEEEEEEEKEKAISCYNETHCAAEGAEKPEEMQRLKEEANQWFLQDDYEAARQGYVKALAYCLPGCRETAMLFGNLAACDLKQMRWQQAVHHSNQAIQMDSNYVKGYYRRAMAYERWGKAANLNKALEDYRKVLELEPHHGEAKMAIARLPFYIEQAQNREKDEMLAQLKDVGNKILGKFGLSTDNFQMKQDPQTGGYSVNFKQGGRV